MKANTKERALGAPLKEFPGDPLYNFLIGHFCNFAWTWPLPADLKRLAIECAPNEWPIVGNPELIHALFRAVAYPETIQDNSEHGRLILVCLKRSPDFILNLLVNLRGKIAKLKPHKRAILFGGAGEKLSDAAKTERHEIRKLAEKNLKAHAEASAWLGVKIRQKIAPGISKKKQSKS